MGMATQPSTVPASSQASGLQALFADLDIDFRRVYMNAVVGGAGGLVGWLLFTIMAAGLLPWLSQWMTFVENLWVRHILTGPLIGASIGFAVGSTEGLLAARSMKRAVQGGLVGLVIGLVSGPVGLLLGEGIFRLGGGTLSRALGWGIFGLLVGTSDGVANKMPVKIQYGILGGLLGGLIGGSTYQALQEMLGGSRGSGIFWGGAIGLVILGACIGFMISLVESLLRKSWLFFLTGRLEGQTRTVDSSRPQTIGSSTGCTIVIPNDASVAPIHAEISFANGEFQIQPRDGQVIVRRDGADQPVTSHTLVPGDRILIGGSRMIFRNVEGKKR
jgi:hypothetical protein